MLWTLSAVASVAAILTAILLVSVDRLPALLSALVVHFMPAFELELGDARLHGLSALDLDHVVVRPRGEATPIFTADRLELRFSPNGLRRAHLDEVRLTAPLIDVPTTLPDLGGDGGGGEPTAWSVGHLVATGGRLRLAPSAERPGVVAEIALDLRQLGTAPEVAQRRQRVRLRRLAVAYPEQPPMLAADAAIARFTMADLLEHQRLDELRVVTPVVTVPETLPVAAAASGDSTPTPWTLGRLVIRDGRVDAPATSTRPGARLGFQLDLRELGLGAEQAKRMQRVRLHDLALTLAAAKPPSVVLDAARVDFTLGDVLDARRVARVRIERGTAVLDEALRTWLAGERGGSGGGAPAAEWRLGRLDVLDLGVRLGDLGTDVPDVTLLIRTVLRDLPLGPAGLAEAREPQRIELADLTLYSPLDPFRRVVRIASIFVEFSLADLVRERIEAITLVSPTIYLGEDLIWYMNAQRADDASDGAPPSPWTIRRFAAELGRVVITFEGADRVQLPIAFHTTAHDVKLDDLTSLRLAADLQVPKQSYRFPGFDVDLVDVEGTLRFDYPPGRDSDNVVNVLRAGEIRWGDYRIGDAWLSVTFDQTGINGKLGGAAYGGYTDAGLSVPFSAGTRSAWIAGERLDLAPFTTQVSSGRAVMTGHATFEGALTLDGTRLDTASGTLTLLGPGELDFPDLDTVADTLGPDAPSWQRDLARIAAQVFQDWPWTSGDGTLAMADYRGTATLAVTGDRGTRRIEAHLYDDVPVVAEATTP
jgi:hypothetical protein